MNSHLKTGESGEKEALKYLANKKYTILETNYKSSSGEIDIIAKENERIVFIEVKTRRTDNVQLGPPKISVNKIKQKKIIKTSLTYLKQKRLQNKGVRYDVISILQTINPSILKSDDFDINHIKGAFRSDYYNPLKPS